MNPEVKALWLSALRSGEYQQGKGWLCAVDSMERRRYCCLGVLCDIAMKAGVVEQHESPLVITYGLEQSISYLPAEVSRWSNLSLSLDEHNSSGEGALTYMNDQLRFDFDRIADWVEENL